MISLNFKMHLNAFAKQAKFLEIQPISRRLKLIRRNFLYDLLCISSYKRVRDWPITLLLTPLQPVFAQYSGNLLVYTQTTFALLYLWSDSTTDYSASRCLCDAFKKGLQKVSFLSFLKRDYIIRNITQTKNGFSFLMHQGRNVSSNRATRATLVQIEIISFRKQKTSKLFKSAKI